MNLQPIDWSIIIVYAVVVITVGLYAARKPKTSESYFLASRQLKWPFIGASLFAANISAEHFVGLAGGGFAIGMAIGGFEWMAIFCLLPLILLFLPFYLSNQVYTVPEFLERRYSAGIRRLFSALMLVLSVLTKVSISLWASSIVFSDVLGWDKMTVIWIVGLITALYTMKGGLSAVVYTDAIQTTVLLIAAIILTTLGLHRVGGWQGLHAKLSPDMFHMIKPATHADVPWPGMFVGVFLAGSFYWSMDQVLVQRVFAAKNLNEGRKGAVFAASLKILTPFILVLPGLIAKALFPNIAKPDDAYPTLLKNLMPTGLLGLTVAGIAAALMGHLSATYNSIATLFTRDFYIKWRPDAGHEQQIAAGRVAVLVVFVLGALWAPIIGSFKSLFLYLQVVGVYLVMPFVGVFFLGVLWKRINTAGVWAAVLAGFVIGPTLMFDSKLHFLAFMQHPLLKPWLHGAIIEFLLCSLLLIGVSLVTAHPPKGKVASTTIDWGLNNAAERPEPLLHDYRLWLSLIVAMTIILWCALR
ncbi:MAG: sodium:solute symporter family transporter [Armatimonadota bacterium]